MSCKILSLRDIPYDSDTCISDSTVFVSDYKTGMYDGEGWALAQRNK